MPLSCCRRAYIWAMIDFITEHYVALIVAGMAFLKVIVNLTPSEKDNEVFGILDRVVSAVIPPRKK